MKHTIFAVALTVASISAAHADAINGLYNTGLGASGSQDIHYTLAAASSDTSISNTAPYITYASTAQVGNQWLDNDLISKWITPTAIQSQTFDASANGSYTYTLTFDLTGYNAASALFTGRLASDNGVSVLLNSNSIGSSVGYGSWSSFSANSGFAAGLNTLEFVVTNYAQSGGNPTGLRVEFQDSNVTAVPEAETYAMLLGGLAMLGALARRRRCK
jgi:hypothetical protein